MNIQDLINDTATTIVDVFPDYPSGTNDFSVFDCKDKKQLVS